MATLRLNNVGFIRAIKVSVYECAVFILVCLTVVKSKNQKIVDIKRQMSR